MSRIRLKFVETYRDRHGRIRRYFRRPGFRRIPLPGAPGSAEFMEAYTAAWEMTNEPGSAARRENGEGRVKPRSVAALVALYYRSADYATLAASTKAVRRAILERYRAEHGDKPVARLERRHIVKQLSEKASTPHAANNLLKILRALMRLAVDLDWRQDDPTREVRALRARSDGIHTWSEDEIATFEARWPVGTRARLAFALMLHTGQRRSDAILMGRQHVRGGAIEVRQQKTGASLVIPLHADLSAVLDAAPKDHLTFLTTAAGKPFSPAGFGNWFRDCCTKAGLPQCSAHGLRKAAARRLAEAGCSVHEIAAITGHETLAEVQRYTRAAEQKSLARAAIDALSGAREGTLPEQELPNLGDPLGKSGEKANKIKA